MGALYILFVCCVYDVMCVVRFVCDSLCDVVWVVFVFALVYACFV